MNLKKIYLETKGTSSFFIVLVLGVVAIKLFYDTMKLLRPVLFFIFGLYERKVLGVSPPFPTKPPLRTKIWIFTYFYPR